MTFDTFLNWSGPVQWITTLVLLALFACSLLMTKLRTNRFITPISTFFVFILVHCLVGYYTGFLTANRIGQIPDAIDYIMNKALIVVAVGVAATYMGYLLFPIAYGDKFGRFLWNAAHHVKIPQLRSRSRLLIVVSVALLVVGVLSLGSIPLFNNQFGKGRYADTFKAGNEWVRFISNRGRDFIQLPAAFLLMLWFRNKTRVLDLFLGVAAIASCLLLLERSPLVDIGLMLVGVLLLRGKTSIFCASGLLLCCGYLGTQVILENKTGYDPETALRIAATALPEVRDFGLLLINEPPRFHGMTLLVGILPIPGFISDFTFQYLLRTVTLVAAGIPLDAGHGGLRITFAGEMYINFGVAGAFVGGLLLGFFCAAFDRLFVVASTKNDIQFDFLISALWMFMFEFYLSGSGVMGMIKALLGVLVFMLIAFPSFQRRAVFKRPVLA